MNNGPTLTSQLTTLFAEVAIMVLGAIALWQGMDGTIFGICIASLAGLGGYHIKTNATTAATIAKANGPKPKSMV